MAATANHVVINAHAFADGKKKWVFVGIAFLSHIHCYHGSFP